MRLTPLASEILDIRSLAVFVEVREKNPHKTRAYPRAEVRWFPASKG